MVWRAGGGGPMRRCIGSTGSLHSYSYPSGSSSSSFDAAASTSPSSSTSSSFNYQSCPIPVRRVNTPPGMGPLSTSPSFGNTLTPPMCSPRETITQPPEPFERTWDEDVVRIVCISGVYFMM